MYLSKLRIYGFKSFANKTEINFPKDGITSVVGPNGCGKSNIVDAIRWVLGEQKVKSLRSTKMEDVIFSGTADLPPMNMAEVSLVIQNDKGLLPGGHSHVMITRQAFRSGESNYKINNQPCRLKDIQHLFYDTGMGAASYSLMESKMIDSILSEKDEERRVLFEEACGISKYKKQRGETMRQLERTSLDLERVSDNLRHTKQSVSLYERQAKKAEKWKELSASIRNTEISYQWEVYSELRDRYRELTQVRDESRRGLAKAESERTTLETQLEERKLEAYEDEKKLSHWNQVVATTQAKGAQLSSEVQRCQDRIHYLEESIAKQQTNKSETESRLANYTRDKNELLRLQAEQKQQLETLKIRLEQETQGVDEADSALAEARRAAQEAQDRRMAYLDEFAKWKDQLGRLTAERDLVQGQMGELDGQQEKESEERVSQQQQVESLEAEEAAKQSVLSEAKDRLQSREDRRINLREDLRRADERYREAEKRKVTLETQQKLLQAMHDSFEGVGQGTQHVLQNRGDSVKGVLADHLKVPESLAGLVERCAGEYLQSLVARDAQALPEILGELAEKKKGKAALYASGSRSFQRSRPDLGSHNGFQGWLIDQIEFPGEVASLVEQVLGHVGIAETYETASAIIDAEGGRDYWLATRDGFLMHASGLVLGGRFSGENQGLLVQKIKLEKNREELTEVESRFQEALREKEEKHGELVALEKELEESKQGLTELESAARDMHSRLIHGRARLEALQGKLSEYETRKQTLSVQLSRVGEQIADLETELKTRETQRDNLERDAEKARAELRERESKRTTQAASQRESEDAHRDVLASLDKIESQIQHLDDSQKQHADIQMKLDLEEKEWGASLRENRERVERLTGEIHELNQRLEEETRERDKAKAVYDQKVMGSEEDRDRLQRLNRETQEFSQTIHKTELKIEQQAGHMRNIEERMMELYEVDFEGDEFEYERVEVDRQIVESSIKSMKEELKQLGNVNVGALEEYEQEKIHLEEVRKQFEDLERARQGLERAIRKLDKLAREQFTQTFEEIRKNFTEVFTTLFEGGQVQLKLEDEVDPLEAKIEINASPSGKKMRGVTLLSGGERALTAISLLFSLYLVRTSPYCIMDEVDGPLDDANIGRFINLLRKFSRETQFLVITHAKRTMAASDMLYGVTQEVKGVSQLSSVKLEEASLIAA